MSDRYTREQARAIAAQIHKQFGSALAHASSHSGVPEHWLAGLIGMESRRRADGWFYVWPDPRSTRFESGVFSKLTQVRRMGGSYNNIRREHLAGASDETVRLLASSWGQTQTMGYYLLTLFHVPLNRIVPASLLDHQHANQPPLLAHLRDPQLHPFFACYMLAHDPLLRKWVGARKSVPVTGDRSPTPEERDEFCLRHAAHIWNSGREWNGNSAGIKTHSPNYMNNVAAVALAYQIVKEANTPGTETRSIAQFADRVGQEVGPVEAASPPTASDVGTEHDGAGSQPSQPAEEQTPDAPSGPPISNWRISVREVAQQLDERIDPMSNTHNRDDADFDNLGGVSREGASSGFGEAVAFPARIERIPNAVEEAALKPGWKTTEGAIVTLAGLVLTIATAFNWTTADGAQDSLARLTTLLNNIGPLMVYLPIVWHFVTSRGKIKSNALRSQAVAQFGGDPMMARGLLGGVIGGSSWKDPARYGSIADIASKLGVPGAGMAADALGAATGQRKLTDEQIIAGFERIGGRLGKVEEALRDIAQDRGGIGGAGR